MARLIIDNFAGGGGASTGIERAIGRSIDIAINHDPEAVAMHLANHPATRHHCQSILAIDPLEATQGRAVDLAWFSPDCKHHSKAKGGKPREKNIRDLAWVVVHWIERLQDDFKRRGLQARDAIRVIILENVEEFRRWGPLDEAGHPIKEREGEEFDLFVRRIRRRSARVEWRELPACDFGAPTSRKRLYMVIRFDELPIAWPEPTHGKRGSADVLSGKLKPWRSAAECIDWSIPAPSIFDRKKPLAEATHRRIAHGVMRYVVNAAEPFIVGAGGPTYGGNPRSAAEPAGTVLVDEHKAIVDAAIVPVTHGSDGPGRTHDPREPLRTITTANGGEMARATVTLAPHVTAFLSQFYTSNTNGGRADPEQPSTTVMAGGQHQAVVCAHMEQANTGVIGHSATAPVSTVTSAGSQQRLVQTTLIDADALPPAMMARAVQVAAFLVKYYGAGDGQLQPLDRPLDTITTLPRFAVVTVTIDATTYVVVDIGMRMLTRRELANAQGFPPDYELAPVGPNGKPLSIAASIRMIGNSVCPDMAEALVRANRPDLCAQAPAVAA